MKNLVLLFPALLTLAIFSCQKDDDSKAQARLPQLPAQLYNYTDTDFPVFWNQAIDTSGFFPNYSNPQNPLTDAGATLGRVLFYDGHLSKNNLIACGSCHLQRNGFADPNQFSQGFKLEKTTRNSMAIVNARFANRYFWDMRASNLEQQVMMPIENHIEMGIERLETLPGKLAGLPYYPDLLQAAFGDTEMTEERIRFALAQYLRSMVSFGSKYDEGVKTAFANFTTLEKMGKDLFEGLDSKAKCGNCHNDVSFSGWGAHSIGLDAETTDPGKNTGQFKIPSLRNIAVTAPYMHDGRFQSLEEVIEHYDQGIKAHHSLSWHLRDNSGHPIRLNLNDLEKRALIAFLETLTDEQYLSDPKFADPFK